LDRNGAARRASTRRARAIITADVSRIHRRGKPDDFFGTDRAAPPTHERATLLTSAQPAPETAGVPSVQDRAR
jgi:hypothetical protein